MQAVLDAGAQSLYTGHGGPLPRQAVVNLEFEQNKDMQATAKRPYSRLLKSPEIRQKAIDSPTCICYNTRDRLRNRLRNLSQQN